MAQLVQPGLVVQVYYWNGWRQRPAVFSISGRAPLVVEWPWPAPGGPLRPSGNQALAKGLFSFCADLEVYVWKGFRRGSTWGLLLLAHTHGPCPGDRSIHGVPWVLACSGVEIVLETTCSDPCVRKGYKAFALLRTAFMNTRRPQGIRIPIVKCTVCRGPVYSPASSALHKTDAGKRFRRCSSCVG